MQSSGIPGQAGGVAQRNVKSAGLSYTFFPYHLAASNFNGAHYYRLSKHAICLVDGLLPRKE